MSDEQTFQAVGRRKEAVARVWLRPGTAAWSINGRTLEDYFPLARHRHQIERPFAATQSEGTYEVHARVGGGGITGQAEALQLAVARALLESDADHRDALRAEGLLTRDARVVERKKPGRPKARKRFQFSKR